MVYNTIATSGFLELFTSCASKKLLLQYVTVVQIFVANHFEDHHGEQAKWVTKVNLNLSCS